LLPGNVESWGVEVRSTIDDVIGDVDVLYMLRMQLERMDSAIVPALPEYCATYSLTPERAARMGSGSILMHPGPINRGVELIVDPADVPGSRILTQVTNGVNVRMAVLFTLLGSGATSVLQQGVES
jgi:aspartate carbamoyltransferase catalytic subunit